MTPRYRVCSRLRPHLFCLLVFLFSDYITTHRLRPFSFTDLQNEYYVYLLTVGIRTGSKPEAKPVVDR